MVAAIVRRYQGPVCRGRACQGAMVWSISPSSASVGDMKPLWESFLGHGKGCWHQAQGNLLSKHAVSSLCATVRIGITAGRVHPWVDSEAHQRLQPRGFRWSLGWRLNLVNVVEGLSFSFFLLADRRNLMQRGSPAQTPGYASRMGGSAGSAWPCRNVGSQGAAESPKPWSSSTASGRRSHESSRVHLQTCGGADYRLIAYDTW